MRADGTAGVAACADIGKTVPALDWLSVTVLVTSTSAVRAGSRRRGTRAATRSTVSAQPRPDPRAAVQHRSADRTEQQPARKPPAAARADDQQLRAARGFRQHRCGTAADHPRLDPDIGILVHVARQRLGQRDPVLFRERLCVVHQREHVPGPVDTGPVQASTASSTAPVSAACLKAKSTAGEETSDPSTPTTTRRSSDGCGAVQPAGTTTTG